MMGVETEAAEVLFQYSKTTCFFIVLVGS